MPPGGGLLIALVAALVAAPCAAEKPARPHRGEIPGVFEPSGAAVTPDGRVIVAEDEIHAPIVALSFDADGAPTVSPLRESSWLTALLSTTEPFLLDDVEGVGADDRGNFYAITSHSRTSNGKREPMRERLVRFRVESSRPEDIRRVLGLRRVLVDADPRLAEAGRITDVKDDNGLNIEALEFDPVKRRLLIGLRGPTIEGRAVIAALANPDEVFDGDAEPLLETPLALLDLDGGGVRSLAYDPDWGGFLIVSAREEGGRWKFWFWDGESAPRRVRLPQKVSIEGAEAVAVIRHGDRSALLFLFDDGDAKDDKPAHYLVLDRDRLEISTD